MTALPDDSTTLSRPGTMTAAFWLLVASATTALLGAAQAITRLLSADGEATIRDAIVSSSAALEGELDVETLVGVSQTTAVAMQVFFAAVSLTVVLVIAFAVRAGRRFVRPVATILAILQAAVTIADVSAVSLISLALVAAAVVLSWLAPSGRYVADRARSRRQAGGRAAVFAG